MIVLAAAAIAGTAARVAWPTPSDGVPESRSRTDGGVAADESLLGRNAGHPRSGGDPGGGAAKPVTLDDVLAASPNQRDTLALAFLGGAEAPAIRSLLEATSDPRVLALAPSTRTVALRLLMEADPEGTLAWAREQMRASDSYSGSLFDLALGIEAETNPAGAIGRAVEHRRLAGLIHVFETLARTSPDHAFQLLADWPLGGPLPAPRLKDAILRLAETDPERLRAVADSAEGWTRRTLAEVLAAVELVRSPAAFEAWLVALDPADRRPLAKAVAEALADSDPAAAARMMGHFPASLDRAEAVADLAGKWTREDPVAAMTWIRESLRGPERSSALAAAADAARATDLETAVALVEEIAASGAVRFDATVKVQARGTSHGSGMGPDPNQAAAAVLIDLAAIDPARALEIAGRLPEAPVDRILEAWMRVDADGAWRHLLSLPEGSFRTESARALGETLGAGKPAEGARRIAAIAGDDPSLATEAASALARAWSGTAPEDALAWAITLPAEAAPRAIGHALQAIARRDADAAMEAVTAVPADRLDESSVGRLFVELDSAGHERLLELLDRLPETARPANAYGSIARQWLGRDPAGAFAWADRLPPGEVRDAAAESLAWALASSNPEQAGNRDLPAAWAWARQIGDIEQRDRMLGWITREWTREAPRAAEAAIRDDSGLDAETKQRLLSPES